MTIKDLFNKFPQIETICWVSACDWLASGNILRGLCSNIEMNYKVRFWSNRGNYIHVVLE